MTGIGNSSAERSRWSLTTDIVFFVLLTMALLYLDTHYVPVSLYQGFLTVIGSFVVVMTISRLHGETLADMGLRRPKRYWTLPFWIIAIFVITLVVAGAGQYIANQFIHTPVDISKFAALYQNLPMLILSLLSIWVTAAFFEEIIYRGFLLRNLVRLSGGGVTAAVTMIFLHAILFGLLHLYQGPIGMISTGLVGFVFGLFYLAQGRNLWAVIIVHGAIDTVGVIQFYFQGVPGTG